MANPLVTGRDMQIAAGKLNDYPGMTFFELNNFVLSTIPGEEELKDEWNCKWWNLIFNCTVEVKDRWESNNGIGRYSSGKALFVVHVDVVANANSAKARVDLELWLVWIAAALKLENSATQVVRLPKDWGSIPVE